MMGRHYLENEFFLQGKLAIQAILSIYLHGSFFMATFKFENFAPANAPVGKKKARNFYCSQKFG